VGRLESRLSRHWPEGCGVLKLNSPTLLKALKRWGGPAALVNDPEAASVLQRMSRGRLEEQRIDRLVRSARETMGLAMGEWDQRRMREDAEQALSAHRQKRSAARQLRQLGARHEPLPALGKVVGLPTACVLWVCLGDPRQYDSGAAYRKAMGLNLAERSSGMRKGELHISKRGKALPRRFLYFAALRYVKREPGVRQWYAAKKARDGGSGLPGLVAVMRKLPLAFWSTARGEAFDAKRLFRSIVASV
jgi:transposase